MKSLFYTLFGLNQLEATFVGELTMKVLPIAFKHYPKIIK